ncbi:MAG: hypothetical protein COW18_06745 [Zetaproteobacteria bacterium CG12_big_fil_rev_8_21_14_0_65_54_13]|nr:MAG: hypothetical protein COW18_06745 [Zetaproteobacteria bacterium CG12_big_fil_rev_8_21_14_0_65_54_13]
MIEQTTIDTIVARVEASRVDDQIVSGLRADFPDLHFTWCMDDDIGSEQPLLEREQFNLYLVNGQAHCLKLTTDPAVANGVVIAEVVE